MMRAAIAFGAGALFGAGLGISGMTRPEKVLAFLDVAGDWDPSLALVMAAAVAIHALAWRLARRRAWAGADPEVDAPDEGRITPTLVAGAAIFGVGWGLAGFCPGPAVVSVVSGMEGVVPFVLAMLGGMALFEVQARLRDRGVKVTSAASAAPPAPRGSSASPS